jgi:DNA invertase Pin-like site-specific DNA recombinase
MCQAYCKQNGIDVAEVFREEGESAKNLKLNNRTEFLRALEFCRKNKGKVDAFVVHKVDRFARNTEDHFLVRKTLLDYGATLHSVTEPIGNKPVEKFVETMLAASAEFDNAIRRQRCIDGQSARINQGIYPHQCPMGYISGRFKARGLKKTEPDTPDEKLFPTIQRGLKEFKTGNISKTDLAELLDSWGFAEARGVKKTTVNVVEKMLTKYLRFYAGLLHNSYTKEYVKGLHKPMITEDEMGEIQFVLSGKNIHTAKKKRFNEDFPLRGQAVLCFECLQSITGSTPKGNGGYYFYYHCKNKDCIMYGKAIKKARIEREWMQKLRCIAPSDKGLELIKESVLSHWEGVISKQKSEVERRTKLVEEFKQKRQRIFDMREDGSYTPEEFQERKEKVENEITAHNIALNETKLDQLDVETTLTFALKFMKDLGRQWFDLPPQLQPRFQKLIFPEGITYNREKGFGTAKLGCLYEVSELLARKKYPLVVCFERSSNFFRKKY